jgi:TIR domain
MNEVSSAEGDTYFLSYSRSDQDFALRLATYVRAQGISLWVDQLDIRPSEHWDRAIERAVSKCRGIVVVLSPRSVASDNVADEISFAIDAGKSVLPVLIERCNLPLRITRMQVIDATGNHDKAFEECVAELRRSKGLGSPPELTAHPETRVIPAADVESVARILAHYLGPIAPVLARRESKASQTTEELGQRLATFIPTAAERNDFLRQLLSK